MRPTNLSTPSHKFELWNSPIPYLFGGIGAMMCLIVVALIILICSHSKPSPEDEPSTQSKSVEKAIIIPLDMEPKIVVVMAGNDMPTFLAKPL
ncbi:Protein GLUTAMINE DUMPER 1 [Ananas comosus]|uniref:Protein GLUTAMINE DUMPER 1 n=1 Tax=Ananas comosus TaxID=4615 RepID=A0A199UJ02_ANACO|nr:Protein GLUTAMINE DUMPER 1 [Ananas comosus]OAY79621.1 Protein GLUTAMINE DUMPER 1 [Ananas comosus]